MRESFLLHLDSLKILDKMPDEMAGQFVKILYRYNLSGELPEMDFAMEMAITPFINQFVRDERKYQKIVQRNAENGKKGGRPKKTEMDIEEPKKPSRFFDNPKNPSEPKKADSDSDNDNGKDNESESKSDMTHDEKDFAEVKEFLKQNSALGGKTKMQTLPKAPSLEDVLQFAEIHMIPKDEAEMYFYKMKSQDWCTINQKTENRVPVADWTAHLIVYFRKGYLKAERKNKEEDIYLS